MAEPEAAAASAAASSATAQPDLEQSNPAAEIPDEAASTAGEKEAHGRLLNNPVHDHFVYRSSDKKSECKHCKLKMAGKNPTSLGK